MRFACFALLILMLGFGWKAVATTIASVKLADLFQQADSVVAVEVLSGTSNSYDVAVYKAKVTEAFKGAKTNDTIFFGPSTGTQVGGNYLLFLRRAPSLSPLANGEPNYGVVSQFNRTMYAGYGSLTLDYACVFDGPDIKDSCDDAVLLNPEQVVLPSTLRVFPAHDLNAETNFKGWVRRAGFFDALRRLETSH